MLEVLLISYLPSKGYQKRTWEICRENDILYISDEVVTGFGRLGHWFASEEVFEIIPDMIMCKGINVRVFTIGSMYYFRSNFRDSKPRR